MAPRHEDAKLPEASGPPPPLRPFIDADGRLARWPAKLKIQLLALEHLAAHFEPAHEYSEKEVNALLQTLHTFGDWALLRRALFDHRFLDREADGSRYRLRPREPEARA